MALRTWGFLKWLVILLQFISEESWTHHCSQIWRISLKLSMEFTNNSGNSIKKIVFRTLCWPSILTQTKLNSNLGNERSAYGLCYSWNGQCWLTKRYFSNLAWFWRLQWLIVLGKESLIWLVQVWKLAFLKKIVRSIGRSYLIFQALVWTSFFNQQLAIQFTKMDKVGST